MIKAKVDFYVKRGGQWSRQEIQLEVEDALFQAASGESSRQKLDSWAKQFFPKADAARVLGITRR